MGELLVRDLDAARRDPVVFAEVVLGQPLWDHQVEVVRSGARYRVLNAGRRAGKTRVFGVEALHLMFTRPGSKVLMISATEATVKRTHAEIAAMATRPLGASSVVEDNVMSLTLSNGSRLESVTASIRAARSAEADLLIVDEAGFVDEDVWQAAEPVIMARPGSRVMITSTPWRGPGHFFHDLWREGMVDPSADVQSWHWPSTVSPLVDAEFLERRRARMAPDYFEREYLAEWTDESGAFFSIRDLEAATAPYELLPPATAAALGGGFRVAGGIDWGRARDQNVVVLVGELDDLGLNEDGRSRLFVPWIDARYRWEYTDFIDELCLVARSYDVVAYASETNGVGDYPTTDLRNRLFRGGGDGFAHVCRVFTDQRRKESGFGMLKRLLQSDRLVLPNHPELLKELRALEFSTTDAGNMRISVPERSGHDDVVMALMQAVSCVHTWYLEEGREPTGGLPRPGGGVADAVQTPRGVRVPIRPRPASTSALGRPAGAETGSRW